ncbi:hypothetical protein ABW20_dc0106316 [Dactylellina cionopaga]|nr:hypothetical protein ABW20_dc0106316 [Dactylellina cionopaga]
MGAGRRGVLDEYLRTLNETDRTEDMVGPWEAEYLFPGDPIFDRRTGNNRPPELFWVIVKRMRKVPSKFDNSRPSNNGPRGVLKDDRRDNWNRSPDSDPFVQEQLLQAVTRINTSNNTDLLPQIQQMQYQLEALRNQRVQQVPQPVPVYANYGQMQPMPYQEQPMQLNVRMPLPTAPVAPSSYQQFSPSRDSSGSSPVDMNRPYTPGSYNNRSPYGQPQHHSSRTHLSYNDSDEYSRQSHLDAQESSSYPRGGAGSRRHSVSSYSHGMSYQDEMLHHQKHGGGMYHDMRYSPQSRGTHHMNNHSHHHPHLEPQKVHMLESWQHDVSSNSDNSEDNHRRPDSRADSMYTSNHLSNGRPRSSHGGVVDLSGGPSGRRNSVSFPGNSGAMIDRRHSSSMVGLGKGFGMSDSASDDGLPRGHHDQRMMHHGMDLPDRSMTRTPWQSRR